MDSFTETFKAALALQDKEKLDKMYFQFEDRNDIVLDDTFLDTEINKNNPYAFCLKADACCRIDDYNDALRWHLRASKMGIGYATAAIGEIYFRGLSDAGQNFDKAMKWFLKAAEQGSYTAMNRIGHMYETGKGVERDEEKSLKWYTQAAEHGSVGAMIKIALCYQYNENYKKAMTWWRKAAEHGDPAAMRNVGILYAEGHGVKQNCKKAFSWYLKSSQYGNNSVEYQMKNLMRRNYNQMMAIFRDLKHERKELTRRVLELERENEELKLRPPTKGGELYLNTKRQFEDRVKKQKF